MHSAVTSGGAGSFRRNPWLVVTSTVNRRTLRAHGTQIDRKLAAVMDAVIVEESQVEGCGKVEGSEEIDGSGESLGRQGSNTIGSALDVFLVPRDQLGD